MRYLILFLCFLFSSTCFSWECTSDLNPFEVSNINNDLKDADRIFIGVFKSAKVRDASVNFPLVDITLGIDIPIKGNLGESIELQMHTEAGKKVFEFGTSYVFLLDFGEKLGMCDMMIELMFPVKNWDDYEKYLTTMSEKSASDIYIPIMEYARPQP